MEYKNKWFGSHKIVSCEKTGKHTKIVSSGGGSELYKVEFDTGDEWIIPQEELDEFCSKKMVDDTTFRNERAEKLALKIIEILLESNIQIEWIAYVLQKVQVSINKSIDFATDKLWDKKFVNLTLLDVDKILKNDFPTDRDQFDKGIIQSYRTDKEKV
jgi:hypothetical protein